MYMPIFDTKCKRCNTVKERLLTQFTEHFKMECDVCSCITWWECEWPLVSMQPDKYWAGQVTNHAGYVTSGSYLKRFEKQNHLERVDRSTLEEVEKKADRRVADWQDNNRKNLNKFLTKELADVEISNDGNTVKEQNKYNRVRK